MAQVVSIDNFFYTMRDMCKQGLKTAFVSYAPQLLINEEEQLKKEASHYCHLSFWG
jgi:hypothetical protein